MKKRKKSAPGGIQISVLDLLASHFTISASLYYYYFLLSLLAEHRASFQRFLGLEV
jgi:hypothetical protein